MIDKKKLFFSIREAFVTARARKEEEKNGLELLTHYWQELSPLAKKLGNLHFFKDKSFCLSFSLQLLSSYKVIGVDGSQVYYDRHEGMPLAYLIHTAAFALSYSSEKSGVELFSWPVCIAPKSDEQARPAEVDGMRFLEEIRATLFLQKTDAYKDALFLIDGPLFCVGSQLLSVEYKQKEREVFNQLKEEAVFLAGVTCSPRSRAVTEELEREMKMDSVRVTDGDLFFALLATGQTSPVFQMNGSFPCCFFYYKYDAQTLYRIDIPLYVMHNREKLGNMLNIIYTQLSKGRGYPLALAHAHFQAIITGSQRKEILACMAHCASVTTASSEKLRAKRMLFI